MIHKVFYENNVFYANSNEVLSNVLQSNGVLVINPCGKKGVCGKCKMLVNDTEVLACKYKINSDITVKRIYDSEIFVNNDIVTQTNLTTPSTLLLDLGSTTLCLTVVNEKGEVLKTATATNSQVAFGSDVISRVNYANENGVKILQTAVVNKINEMILSFNLPFLNELIVAGNTTMLHLLLGEEVKTLGVHPYTPLFLEGKSIDASSLNIQGVKKVVTIANISTFVGADITMGVYAYPPVSNGYNLLIDLGTNAEIVLYGNGKYYATSAACGPCFEGGNISCGVGAINGAIYSFTLENGSRNFKTINNAYPVGICGSGIIDVIATLLKNDIIDKQGVLLYDSYPVANGVYLTKTDAREFQLAKSAVYTAITTLLHANNVDYQDVKNVYVAGGFSTKINFENAFLVGLLPNQFKGKCVAVNNSCMKGLIKYAIKKDDLTYITQNSTYLNLSNTPFFNENFIKNLTF